MATQGEATSTTMIPTISMHRITTKVTTRVATKVEAKEKRKDEKENEGKKTLIKCHRFEYRPVLALVPCWPCIWPRKK